MSDQPGASPHTSHTSRLASVSTPSEAPQIGGDDDEKSKAQRLAELKMQKQKLEEEVERLRSALKSIADHECFLPPPEHAKHVLEGEVSEHTPWDWHEAQSAAAEAGQDE